MKRHAREREIRLWSNMRQGDGDTASDHNSEAAARLPRVWAARGPSPHCVQQPGSRARRVRTCSRCTSWFLELMSLHDAGVVRTTLQLEQLAWRKAAGTDHLRFDNTVQRYRFPMHHLNASYDLEGYTASGGGDNPEQGLNALSQGATTTSWRAGSKKIEVITGDAPSHSSPSHPPAANGVGVSSVASTLTSDGVTMIASNVGSAADGTPGLGGDTSNGLNAYGQFSGAGSLLANGVSGTYEDAIPDATTLANDIIAAIVSSFSTYSTVSLALIGPAPTDCSVSLPSGFSGSFDRSVTRTFGFGDVSIKGTHAGVCSFTIGLEADGALLATKSDTITVGSAVPEPAALAVLVPA